ncbi:ABC-2 family transporter protein [Caldanaerobius fijiensis DSM 17918]|uniref:ABC-2 family transporter protein n=1 Tax=Caldanaerobius fijiensis DSM 17918 TaxID=1121256 RepID=A0A1M4WB62_9THEO|nr:ABC transporter permease [Caldanaerobius fijiensis]SHE78459.1 ABC-2 family transporter protein [Caldanaerobius fijiensis DSM 17918]
MKALYIGIKDTLITLRDYKALALIIMMPLILILVLGMALGPVFNSGGLKSFEIALVDNDKGEMSRVFKEKVLDNKEVKKFVRYKEMSEEKAREDIKEGRLPAAIIIPAGFSDDFKNGKKTEMIVLKSPAEELKASIVEQLARSFIETASSAKISTDEVLKKLCFRKTGGNPL